MFNLRFLEDKDKKDQINLVVDYLEAYNIESRIVTSSWGKKSAYCVGEDTVFAVVHKPASEELEFVLMDRPVYDTFLADGKGSLSLVKRDRKSDYKVMISRDRIKRTLHREVFNLIDSNLIKDLQVDHITHNTMINTRDFLRPCTGSQNIKNRVISKEWSDVVTGDVLATDYMSDFSYNPLLDFRDTWYAVVFYKMLGLSSKELCDYNRDYMFRHNRLSA